LPTNPTNRAGAYFICATPRTGSSLLLGLLQSTGVAGRPEAYFREPDEQSWAERWRLAPAADGRLDYAHFVRAAIAAGQTENGVFGAKLMWGTLDEVVDKLAAVYPDDAGPGADLTLLTRAFGEVRFVYLRRDDVVAQAVSWLRAEQTGTWYVGDSTPGAGAEEPRFDAQGIRTYAERIARHNGAWEQWFWSFAIEPYVVHYEGLCADMVGVTRGVLDFLQIDLPAGRDIVARHQRQSDELSAQWIDRYNAVHASRTRVLT
jgi:LPS sulfotransferase NodH